MGNDYTLSTKITGDASSFSSAAKTATKILGATAAAASAAIVKIGKDSLEAYADYEQLTGGIETLFSDAYDTVMSNANNAYKTTGLSANDYMEQVTSFSASLLQATKSNTEEAAKYADMAMTDMADNANKMGTPMESIQNAYQGFAKQNYTMLDNLKLGYGGTKEEMERLLADAEKISGVKYDISNLADVYSAIHVVQEELGITGTTAKEASTTIQGSVSMMKASWENLLVGIADDNQDFDLLMSNFVDSVITVGNNVIPRVETIIGGIGNLISSLVETVLPQIVEKVPPLIEGMLPTVSTALSTLISSIATMLPELVNTVVNVLPQILTEITSLLPTLIYAGIDIVLALISGITDSYQDIIDAIIDIVFIIVEELLDPDQLCNIINAGIEMIFALANGLVDAIPQLLPVIPEIIDNVVRTLIGLLPELIPVAIQLITLFAKGLITSIPILAENLPIIIDTIIHTFETVDWGSIGKFIIQGLIDGLKSMISSLGDAVVNIASGISESFKSALGIHSPSKLFMEYGIYTDEGYAIGIAKGADNIYKSFNELDLTSKISNLPSASEFSSAGAISSSGQDYISTVEDLGDYIIAAVNTNAKAIEKGIGNMRLVAGNREAGRFISNLGFVKA